MDFVTVPLAEGGSVQAVRVGKWTSMLLAGGDGPLAGLCLHANLWSAQIVVMNGEQLDKMIEQLSVHRMHMRAQEGSPDDKS